jgi:ubiquinone biosynthesis monooxygenase Coq7
MLRDFFKLEETEEEMIRVNHAGELGAKQIYLGQLKALNGDVEILEMLESELEHLEYFEEKIKQTGVRPSMLNEIWKPCAFLMGYLSAKIGGRKIAMLCTEKVEEVIEKHYENQISILKNSELKEKIIKFRAEEIEHMKIGKIEGRESELIGKLFSGLTKLAIVLSKKI